MLAGMHEQDKAILEGLVCVAWSDGTFEDREKEMLDALLEGFGATEEEQKEVRDWADTPRKLEDIPLNELSFGDRRTLYAHAVVLTWVDGDQADSEVAFLEQLREQLRITEDEGKEIFSVSSARAKQLLAEAG